MNLIRAVIIAAIAAGAFAPATTALAADVPSFVKKGVVYKTVRKKLKKNWRAIGASMRVREDGQCESDDPRCDWTETRDCASSGLANCIMVWEHKRDGTTMEINTAGEEDEVITRARVAD